MLKWIVNNKKKSRKRKNTKAIKRRRIKTSLIDCGASYLVIYVHLAVPPPPQVFTLKSGRESALERVSEVHILHLCIVYVCLYLPNLSTANLYTTIQLAYALSMYVCIYLTCPQLIYILSMYVCIYLTCPQLIYIQLSS